MYNYQCHHNFYFFTCVGMISLKNVHLLSKSIDPCHQYLHVCVVSQEFGNPVIIEPSQQKLIPQGYQPSIVVSKMHSNKAILFFL